MAWLAGKTKLVFHNDTRILYTVLATIGSGTFCAQLVRHRMR
jgi:hypothetical protein